jgi:hypothetical protein
MPPGTQTCEANYRLKEMHSHGRETSTDRRATHGRAAAPAVEGPGRSPFERLRLGRLQRLAELPATLDVQYGEPGEVLNLDAYRRDR